MLTYLELVYNGGYLGKFANGFEYWRYGQDIFVTDPQTDLILGPMVGTGLL